MSERPHDADLDPYEEEMYTDFIESYDLFESQQDLLFASLRNAMNGKGGRTFADAKESVYKMKRSMVERMIDLTEIIFDSMERNEAIDVWSNIIDMDLNRRLEVISYINPRAAFEPLTMIDIQINAAAYADGRWKAHQDGVLGRADETQTIQYDLFDNQIVDLDADWDNLSEVSEGDEYAEWVLDEYDENIDTHVENLLDLCPPGLYEQ